MKYFDSETPKATLQQYLFSKGWIQENEEIININTAGEGNMNIVLRIATPNQSFILKQSRPFVQKYQQIAAPLNRIAVEYQFYQAVQNDSLKAHIPKILGYDPQQHLLLMEDLGYCEDLSSLYEKRTIDTQLINKLTQNLLAIHQNKVPHNFPDNLAMRNLNHEHIFVLPFLSDNGFQLDAIQNGLEACAAPYKTDSTIKNIVDKIGEKYLSPGNTLLHGDYYPGSWMTADKKLYIIDPEFGFAGFPEFDLGVMAAHIIMATDNDNHIKTITSAYNDNIDKSLLTKVAGIEIMRRLIGLAQLPLQRTISEKQYLLHLARKMIVS